MPVGPLYSLEKCLFRSSAYFFEWAVCFDAVKTHKLFINFRQRCKSSESVQSLNQVWIFATPWIAACQVSMSITNSPEPTQTHVHRVGDAIQPSHYLPSPSPPTFNLSQHQGLFQWVHSSHQVAKILGVSPSASVLPMNIQDWFPLGWTGWISLQSKGLSRSSPTPQFKRQKCKGKSMKKS